MKSEIPFVLPVLCAVCLLCLQPHVSGNDVSIDPDDMTFRVHSAAQKANGLRCELWFQFDREKHSRANVVLMPPRRSVDVVTDKGFRVTHWVSANCARRGKIVTVTGTLPLPSCTEQIVRGRITIPTMSVGKVESAVWTPDQANREERLAGYRVRIRSFNEPYTRDTTMVRIAFRPVERGAERAYALPKVLRVVAVGKGGTEKQLRETVSTYGRDGSYLGLFAREGFDLKSVRVELPLLTKGQPWTVSFQKLALLRLRDIAGGKAKTYAPPTPVTARGPDFECKVGLLESTIRKHSARKQSVKHTFQLLCYTTHGKKPTDSHPRIADAAWRGPGGKALRLQPVYDYKAAEYVVMRLFSSQLYDPKSIPKTTDVELTVAIGKGPGHKVRFEGIDLCATARHYDRSVSKKLKELNRFWSSKQTYKAAGILKVLTAEKRDDSWYWYSLATYAEDMKQWRMAGNCYRRSLMGWLSRGRADTHFPKRHPIVLAESAHRVFSKANDRRDALAMLYALPALRGPSTYDRGAVTKYRGRIGLRPEQANTTMLLAFPAGAMKVDGDLAEWDAKQFSVYCSDINTELLSKRVEIAYAYDDTSLYLAARLIDPILDYARPTGSTEKWSNILLNNAVQLVTGDPKNLKRIVLRYSEPNGANILHRLKGTPKGNFIDKQAKVSMTPDLGGGYEMKVVTKPGQWDMEARIPWTELVGKDFKPTIGKEIPFSMFLTLGSGMQMWANVGEDGKALDKSGALGRLILVGRDDAPLVQPWRKREKELREGPMQIPADFVPARRKRSVEPIK